jgi:hypothetical protein
MTDYGTTQGKKEYKISTYNESTKYYVIKNCSRYTPIVKSLNRPVQFSKKKN